MMTSASEFVLNYVVNVAWQIVAISIVAALGSFLLRNAPAHYCHVLWLVALILSVFLPVLPVTATDQKDSSVVIAPAQTPSLNDESVISVVHLTKRRTQVVSTSSRTALWSMLAYALFVLWRAIRLGRFWWRKEGLRRSKLETLTPAGEHVAQRCRAILGITKVDVAQSSDARVPYTIGVRNPLIVLPESFCVASEERLLSVIGHEMAHVARRDYLSNLVCELMSIPIWFHPLTYVIKRQIDRERELACDELVSRHLLPAKLYARSLVWAAGALSKLQSPALLLSIFDGRSLEERVTRLTRRKRMFSRSVAAMIMSIAILALGVSTIALSLFSFELKTHAEVAIAHVVPPRIEQVGGSIINPPTSPAPQARVANSPNGPSPQERAAAACEAGRKGDVEKIPTLIAMLGDDSKTELLVCWNTGRWSPALETFKQPSPGEQAAIALASMGPPAFRPLTTQLGSANSSVRRNAAWAIGELRRMPPGERDDAVPQLISLLGDTDAWVRMAAARALGELRNETAVPKLIATLGDADGRVRELAVWALSELKDARAVVALCNVLLSDERVEVRQGAAEALGEIRSPEALPSLKQALNDPNLKAKVEWAISEIEG
jgi:HEAT repeat protein/beta-lactamase regulating signal transducer with metallopeptidase domain